MDKEIYEKIIAKKEFSDLPKKDIEVVFSKFDKDRYSDEEKIKMTRDLLRKIFSGFASRKLLISKERDKEWILKKHLSTRERFPHYKEIYSRLLKDSPKELIVFDFGSGVNGFSFKFFERKKIKYLGIEAIGQLVSLTNNYFKKNRINGFEIHQSLFDLKKIKEIIKKEKGYKIGFLFKTIDSLETIENNYSKNFISEIAPFMDKFVVSFATESMMRRRKFFAERKWIVEFIEENFEILDNFKLGGEKYIVFQNKV